ncbi:hypothetical protein MGMO_172c00110 [Methyloglobulus morosus KoM1]|uniref:Cytochrome c family protein n=1 Tax=Methyloglobulus morosus KoM1 TaxID=1116472 RepID=V5B1T1_9GAMM|nr:hypothetical protein [Methyloglobulus morosus]ESS67095.1 hypothetical protein MGMO_172c00110 [Methyloglobulus morosus KoM1]
MNRYTRLTVLLLVFSHFPGELYAQGYPQNALCVNGQSTLCSTLPVDLPNLAIQTGYFPKTDTTPPSSNVAQDNFDWFSWQMFIALNWPADSSGKPLPGPIGKTPSAPRVWQGFQSPDQVFPGNGINTKSCAANKKGLVLFRTSKFSTNSFIEPTTPWPLIDQAGNYVIYDVRMGAVEVNYLKKNGLLTTAGQKKFTGSYSFPTGLGTSEGAIELKTAWRILTDPASYSNFFTSPATVVVPAQNSVTGKEMCLDVTVGLVGMHIMQKITNPPPFSNFWVWATFEHNANAPTAQGVTPSQSNQNAAPQKNSYDPLQACPAPTAPGSSYSFFSPSCTNNGASCTPNQPPAIPSKAKNANYLWQEKPPFAQTYLMDGKYGTQVVRCWDIYDSAKNVTAQFQAALAGTPWANYMLVGAQWAEANATEFPSPVMPFAAPFYLTNTTLETYLQLNPIIVNGKPSTDKPGSCIGCHNVATDSVNKASNFSFLPGYAK